MQVGHDVVGVQADEQVREADEVHHRAQLVLGEPLDRDAAAVAGRTTSSRRRRSATSSRPSTSRRARRFSPLCGGLIRRQLGVDRRAVVALLVVLGDDLPVGRQLVGVPVDDRPGPRAGSGRRPPRGRRRARRIEPSSPLGSTNSQPCQSTSAQLGEPELAASKSVDRGTAGRVAQRRRRAGRTRSGTGRRCAPLGRRRRTRAARARGAGRCWRTRGARRPRRGPAARRSAPVPTAVCAPGSAKSAAWPTHIQPEKMLRCSHSKTAGSTYASSGQHPRRAERCAAPRRRRRPGAERRDAMLFEHTVRLVAGSSAGPSGTAHASPAKRAESRGRPVAGVAAASSGGTPGSR